MIRINLLPVRISKKKVAGKQQLVFFALAAVFVLICNFWWNHSRAEETSAREEKVKRTRSEIAQLDRIIGEVKNIKAEQAAVRDKLAVLDKLRAGRQGPVRMMDELATIIPKRVWLRRMDEKAGSVVLDGSAGTIEDVSEFLSALKRAQFFTGPELKKTSAKQDGKFKAVEFSITAGINYAAAIPVAVSASVTPSEKVR